MAAATEKPKVGNVTIATVKSRGEARRITARLDSAGIESQVFDERELAIARSGRLRFGGIKVQVNRANARSAVRVLREDHHEDKAGSPDDGPGRDTSPTRTRLDGWKRAAMIGVMAIAGLLAAWLL